MNFEDRCPRRYDVEPKELFRMRTGVGAASGTSRFKCATPDPRVWVKFGVIWVPQDGSTAPGGAALTLWVSQLERTKVDEGSEFPVEDLLGTSAGPVTIPTNTALYGKFVEVQTAKTGLQGVMAINTPSAGVQGSWFAKASYFPSTDMPREEWNKLIGFISGIAADNPIALTV